MKTMWVTPVLETYGTVVELTKELDKNPGGGDGVVLGGVPIGNPSQPCNCG